MKRLTLSFALGLVLIPLALAQEDPDPFMLEKLLPDSTLLYVNIPNSDAVSADYAKSSLYKLIHNDEIKYFMDVPLAYFEKHRKQAGAQNEPSWNDQAKEATGLTIDEMLELAQGPIGFAVLDLPFNEAHKLDLVFSLGNPDGKKLTEAAARVKAAAKKQSQSLVEGEFTFKGVSVTSFGNRDLTVHYASLGRTLVCATSEERMRSMIAAHVDKDQPTLERTDAFKKAKAAVAKESRHLFMLYAHVPSILKTFGKEIGDDAMKTLEKLGVTDLTGVAAALSYDGPQIRERYSIGMSSQTRGIPKLLAGKPSADKAARYVPCGAVAYSFFSWNLAEVYDTLLSMLEVDPKTQETATRSIREFEERVGVKIRDDLLASLGDDWSAWSAFPEAGGVFPDSVYVVSLRDAARFESSLTKVLADLKQKIEVMSFHGQEIKYLSVSMDKSGPDASDPFQFGPIPSFGLSYFIKDGWLFVGMNPLALKRLILRSQDAGAKDISADPAFNAAAAKLGGKSDAFMYMDVGRLFMLVYNSIDPPLQLVREFARDPSGELIVDLARLPLGDTLGGLIGTSFTAKRTDGAGVVIESISSVGLTATSATIFIGGAAAAAGFLFLEARRAPEAPGGFAENERLAQTALKNIKEAQELFKNSDSDGNGIADYWTRDVAGLYALKSSSGQMVMLIDAATGKADPDGADNYEATKGAAQPSKGYYFKVLHSDQNGDAYQIDEAKTGNAWTNRKHFGAAAYPAQYGVSGRMTFIINEDGKVYKKDTAGKPVDAWPGKDPTKQGWLASD